MLDILVVAMTVAYFAGNVLCAIAFDRLKGGNK
jgi:hypothetical protein